MAYNFRDYNPKQSFLLPPSLDDWLPENHLARFISEIVDQTDLSEFIEDYNESGRGNAAYHPAMMVKILLYAYCIGINSSRKIERALVEDVAFRWLAANNFPDFRTICLFRNRHAEAFEKLFLEVLLICREAGLVKTGIIAVDGTKERANASLSRNRSYEQILEEEERLREKVRRILEEAKRVDEEEDRIYGEKRGDELPEELDRIEKRLERIGEAKRRLEEARRKREDGLVSERGKVRENKREGEEVGCRERGEESDRGSKSRDDREESKESKDSKGDRRKKEVKINLTDSDSRIQKTLKGYIQGYNAQAVVSEDQIILAYDVVNDANDVRQFKPMVDKALRNVSEIGGLVKTILADAGYCSEENFRYVESLEKERDIEVIINTRKERKVAGSEGKRVRSKLPGYKKMERRVRKAINRFIYSFRKKMIEPVFGQIKSCQGFRGFLLRGLEKVRVEFSLWCNAHNILKLYRHKLKGEAIVS